LPVTIYVVLCSKICQNSQACTASVAGVTMCTPDQPAKPSRPELSDTTTTSDYTNTTGQHWQNTTVTWSKRPCSRILVNKSRHMGQVLLTAC